MRFLSSSVTRSLGKAILSAKHQSPHIFFGFGVAGVVGGAVLACKGTLKVEKVLDTLEEETADIKASKERMADAYPTPDYANDLGKSYLAAGGELAKLYGPAIIVGGLGIACLTGSHVQLTRRNTALSATVAALTKGFKEYRERVRKELGEKKELDIYRNLEYVEGKDEDGKKIVVTQHASDDRSPYARCFDEFSTAWLKNAELNLMFLKVQQEHANYRLQSRGHLFLNEVYDDLGFERTEAGQIVGWVYGGAGDDYVDFGLHHVDNKDFLDGTNRSVWLDFNVDGPIHELIGQKT